MHADTDRVPFGLKAGAKAYLTTGSGGDRGGDRDRDRERERGGNSSSGGNGNGGNNYDNNGSQRDGQNRGQHNNNNNNNRQKGNNELSSLHPFHTNICNGQSLDSYLTRLRPSPCHTTPYF